MLGGAILTRLVVTVWMTTCDLAHKVCVCLGVDEHEKLTERQLGETTRVDVDVHTATLGIPCPKPLWHNPVPELLDVMSQSARCSHDL